MANRYSTCSRFFTFMYFKTFVINNNKFINSKSRCTSLKSNLNRPEPTRSAGLLIEKAATLRSSVLIRCISALFTETDRNSERSVVSQESHRYSHGIIKFFNCCCCDFDSINRKYFTSTVERPAHRWVTHLF